MIGLTKTEIKIYKSTDNKNHWRKDQDLINEIIAEEEAKNFFMVSTASKFQFINPDGEFILIMSFREQPVTEIKKNKVTKKVFGR